MKKAVVLIALCAMLLCLPGCGSKRPDAAVDGTPWGKDWLTINRTLGVEELGHGLTLRDEKGAKNMFYNGWSIGEEQTWTDASGEEIKVYDAQLTILLMSDKTEEEAHQDMDQFLTLADASYTVDEIVTRTCNGQEYVFMTYAFPPGTSAFSRGASAFTTFGSSAISVEFVCRDSFAEDPGEVLADILACCHYAAEG